jgi:hypothetical protein
VWLELSQICSARRCSHHSNDTPQQTNPNPTY